MAGQKKSGCLKTVLIAAGIFLVLCVFIGMMGGSDDDSADQSGNSKEQTAVEEQAKKETQATEETQEKKKIEKSTEEQKEVFECEYEDTTLKYRECKITEDDLGTPVLVLFFDYANNSNDNKAFSYTYSVKMFQNGVEMDDTFVYAGEETRNASRELQPGTGAIVASSVKYTGDKAPISVEVEPWVNLGSKKLIHFNLEF